MEEDIWTPELIAEMVASLNYGWELLNRYRWKEEKWVEVKKT